MKRFLFILKLAMVTCLMAGMVFMSGCQNEHDPDAFHLYYVNEDKTRLVGIEYEVQAEAVQEQVSEVLIQLTNGTDRAIYLSPIPAGVSIIKYDVTDGFLSLHFEKSYMELNNIEETLCRAAIVKTLVQLEEVFNVAFYVENEPLVDATGDVIGAMNETSFIDNPGEDIQTTQKTELVLYFASNSGKSLVKEVQEVYYDSNVSTEKLIIQRLLAEPRSENAQNAIPMNTQLVNISVMDGICVVNFDNGFKNYNYDISEDVVIYSIVNSLTELDTIKAVQISINGETNMVYREKMNLAEQYTRNLALVTETDEDVEVVDEVAPKGGALTNRTE